MYTYISSRASVVMILHSMRMSLFLCISSSYHYMYSTSHLGHHYVSPVVYVLINSHYLSLDPHYLFFDIVTSMGMPASSIYMSEIICTSSIFQNKYKPKDTIVRMRRLHFYVVLSGLSTIITICICIYQIPYFET